ncbi:MAG: DNA mismatch repair protein MutS, partial [candidate division Zixibacteria bacterium]|nr:DNA mismatch repair protein MutS [candidate division Zixibacteria bacterium]
MRQYHAIKEQHPDKILFFRMGDFYEMFGDDAVKAAPILSIVLTSRSHGESERIPLAGVPYHAADKYLARLLAAGEKVVVVEQVEDPKEAKGIVKREIVEILTPGTATVEAVDGSESPPCLAAVFPDGKANMGLAALDLSTGSFVVDEGPVDDIVERLKVLAPAELLYPADLEPSELARRLDLVDGVARITPFGEWNFDVASAHRDLNQHFGTATLEGFGVVDSRRAIGAAGAILRYLRENHRDRLAHITRLTRFDTDEHMHLDYSSVRNLELIRSIATAGEEHSLFAVINHTQTLPGARRLRSSLLRPFKSKTTIERRLSGVSELLRHHELRGGIQKLSKGLPDLEKLAGRLGIGKLSPRQAASIKDGLVTARQLKELLGDVASPLLTQIAGSLLDNSDIISMLDDALAKEPPPVMNKGDIFKRGYSQELDALNDSIHDARVYIASLQEQERQRTGIATLKVGFNKVFGYYLEITKVNTDAVPSEYIRKQTLVNAERYITPELKEKEGLILSAEEKIFRLEEQLYLQLMDRLEDRIGDIISTADLLAELDLVSSLAELAVTKNYCRPEIFEDCRLVIKNGRHPVIEAVLEAGAFVANNAMMTTDERIHILTGPNMSGKSTFLRQIGLIVILAQIGSFVPADSA